MLLRLRIACHLPEQEKNNTNCQIGNFSKAIIQFFTPDNIPIFLLSEQIRIFVINTRVMTTKLTLTVEEEVIKKAKSYAKQTGRSLSELIEKYLETLTEEHREAKQISPKLRKLVGSVKLPADFDEKKELDAYFESKHL